MYTMITSSDLALLLVDGDDCLSQPCKNGATCIDLIRDYRFECAPGYYGITCDNREFSIVRESRHVTPCLSSAPSSTGYCEPVCQSGQREIGRFRVQDLYVDYYSERMSHERNEEM